MVGKVALVTGAASGIGRATALALARFGADVAICDRDADELAHTAEQIAQHGRHAHVELLDVRDADAVADAVRGADAAVIVTEWDELRDLARPEIRDLMARPLIIDGRNLLDPGQARAAGFAYEGIGRPVSPGDVLAETPERDTKTV